MLRSVRQYLNLTNRAFGGLYNFQGPGEDEVQALEKLRDRILARGGKGGLVQHMRQNMLQNWAHVTHAEEQMTSRDMEKEVAHNLMAQFFLGQQSLPNLVFWVVLRLAAKPALLVALRSDPSRLAGVIKEELRLHPPSSPFLMPYKCGKGDSYNGVDIPKGALVIVLPALCLGGIPTLCERRRRHNAATVCRHWPDCADEC